MIGDDGSGLRHLLAEEVAAYLDRGVSATERQRLEAHLGRCAECRDELAAVRYLGSARGRRRAWYVLLPAAAAAAIVLAVGLPGAPSSPGDVLRSGDRLGTAERIRQFTAVQPTAAATVHPDSVRFVWASAGHDASYRLTLASPAGDTIWTISTGDTTVALAPDVALDRGKSYFWYVDAILPDGSTATTGAQQFGTIP